MTRRPWFFLSTLLLGGCAWADAGDEAHAMIEGMHAALLEGKAEALRAFFDPKMPGFARISNDIAAMLKESLAPSAVDFAINAGDGRARDLELDWRLEIRARNGESSVERRARVKLRAEKRDGNWRIVSFAPLDFFAPVKNGDVWDAISEALGALTAVSGDPVRHDSSVPARFLDAFDPKMPGYGQMRTNVMALIQQGDIESSVEPVGSQGDDQRRSLELDWVLSVVKPETGIAVLRRHERVKCQVERQRGKWRIVALDPIEFLAPEKAE